MKRRFEDEEVSSEQLRGPPTAGCPSWGLGAGLTSSYVRSEHVICYAVLTVNMLGRGLRFCEHGNEPLCPKIRTICNPPKELFKTVSAERSY